MAKAMQHKVANCKIFRYTVEKQILASMLPAWEHREHSEATFPESLPMAVAARKVPLWRMAEIISESADDNELTRNVQNVMLKVCLTHAPPLPAASVCLESAKMIMRSHSVFPKILPRVRMMSSLSVPLGPSNNS